MAYPRFQRKLLLLVVIQTVSQLFLSPTCVLGVVHNANGIALAELSSFFEGSTIVSVEANAGGTATCPSGKVIIWGHTIMYNHHYGGTHSCMKNKNTVCTAGATSCTMARCSSSNDDYTVGRVVILCGNAKVPGSYLVSTRSEPGGSASRAECNVDEDILFGHKYFYAWYFKDCPPRVNYACPFGTSQCQFNGISQSTWTECKHTMHVANILCAPLKYVNALVEYASIPTAGYGNSVSCNDNQDIISTNGENVGPRSLMLFGASAFMSDGYSRVDVDSLSSKQRLCAYDSASCSMTWQNTRGDEGGGGFAVCVPRIEIVGSPTGRPTDQPTQRPTTTSTKQPTAPQTSPPTRLPTSFNSTIATRLEPHGPPIAIYVAAGVGSVAALAVLKLVLVRKKRLGGPGFGLGYKYSDTDASKLSPKGSGIARTPFRGKKAASFESTYMSASPSPSFSSGVTGNSARVSDTIPVPLNIELSNTMVLADTGRSRGLTRESVMSSFVQRSLTESVTRPTSSGGV